MKHQYYGDLNDYAKYAILRALTRSLGNPRLVILWYLTPNDESGDGRRVRYLDDETVWGRFDPPLFANLRNSVRKLGERSITRALADMGIEPRPGVVMDYVPETELERAVWVKRCAASLRESDLLFVDPDVGLSTRSARVGRKGSSKYVFDHELQLLVKASPGASVLVYQHFPRVERASFMDACSARLHAALGRCHVMRLSTTTVAYLIVPADEHRTRLRKAARSLAATWEGVLMFSEWSYR